MRWSVTWILSMNISWGAFKAGAGLSNVKAVAEKYHDAVSVKSHGGVSIEAR